jgi:enterochelin esterase family protein
MTTVSNSIIERALKSGNPVVDTDQAIFIWEGESAPQLTSDLNHWDNNPKRFKRVSPKLIPDTKKSIWSCTLSIPRDAYVEYAFYDSVTQKKFLDPLNKKSVDNGYRERNNFFYMPETMPSPYPMRRADVTPGKLSSHRVETRWLRDDYEREIYLYRPPVKEPVPLLVVLDGKDYLQRGKLNVIVDNLIADEHIQPIAMAFLPSGNRWRDVEYSCSDGTILWLDEIVLPFATEKLNLLNIKEHPGAYGVLGASLGGTMSMYTGLRMPDVFGKVLSQAGAYTYTSRDFSVVDLARNRQSNHVQIWMDVGRLDTLLEDNLGMNALLTDKGYDVTYREHSGGHNYTSWRNNIWRGLEAIFPHTQ